MKFKRKTLEQSLTRIQEERLVGLMRNKEPTWYITQAYNTLRYNHKYAEKHNEPYKGHPRLMENAFCDYMRKHYG